MVDDKELAENMVKFVDNLNHQFRCADFCAGYEIPADGPTLADALKMLEVFSEVLAAMPEFIDEVALMAAAKGNKEGTSKIQRESRDIRNALEEVRAFIAALPKATPTEEPGG